MVLAVAWPSQRCSSDALLPPSALLPFLLFALHWSSARGGPPPEAHASLDEVRSSDMPQLLQPLHVMHDQELSWNTSLWSGPKLPLLSSRTALDAITSFSLPARRLRDESLPPVGTKHSQVGPGLLSFGALMLDHFDNDENRSFHQFDVSKDGQIDVSEIAAAAGQLNYRGSQKPEDLFKSLDANADGRVTLDEFDVFKEEAKALKTHEQSALGSGTPALNWKPGLPSDFSEEQSAPMQGAHRRRTRAGNDAPLAKGSVTIGSYVLWMKLGRTSEIVPVAWAGEYDPLDDGKCRTISGHPVLEETLENTPKVACQVRCSGDPTCYGYSWSSTKVRCTHYKESGLRGGGGKEEGAICNVKLFLLVEDGVTQSKDYEKAGTGKCLSGPGTDYPESQYRENIAKESTCASQCTDSPGCFGYSWSMSNQHCYMWQQPDLRASGSKDDSYFCMVKVYEVSGDGDATAGDDLPANRAPYVDLSQPVPSAAAIKMPLGRTISTAPVLWTGNWEELLPKEGRCMTSDGEEPARKVHDDFTEQECSDECAGQAGCFGYSWDNTRQCMLWMQPDLWGGGARGDGLKCVVKQFGVVRETVKHLDGEAGYTNAGAGMCKTPWKQLPASKWMGTSTAAQCNIYCDGDETCFGYSWEKSNGDCALHMESGLRGSKSGYSDITCFIKTFQVVGAQAAGAPQYPAMQTPPPASYSSPQISARSALVPAPAPAPQYYPMPQGTVPYQPQMQPRGAPQAMPMQMPAPRTAQTGQYAAGSYIGGGGGAGSNHGGGGGSHGGGGGGSAFGFDNILNIVGSVGAAHATHHAISHFTSNGENQGNNGQQQARDNGYGNSLAMNPAGNVLAQHQQQQEYQWWTPQRTSATCDTILPTAQFPGSTPEASQQQWGAGKEQPRLWDCWSKDPNGHPKVCWYKKVLDDMGKGWKGACDGLRAVNPGSLGCQEHCMRNPWCSIWQTKGTNGYVTCYQGLKGAGYDCQGYHTDINFIPSGAERLQHGNVRVLKDLTGWEIHGLRVEFDSKYYSSHFDATLECQNICYSNLECGYWIYSTKDGCLVEDPPDHVVHYPLTTQIAMHHGAFARSVIAGEMIQHYCEHHDEVDTTAGEDYGEPDDGFSMWPWEWKWFDVHMPWDEGGWSWWVWLINITFFCCYCGCCCTLCLGGGVCFKCMKSLGGGGDKKKEANSSDSSSESDSDEVDEPSVSEGLSATSSACVKEEKPTKSHHKHIDGMQQHFNHMAQGHSNQAMHAMHSNGAADHGARYESRPLLPHQGRVAPY